MLLQPGSADRFDEFRRAARKAVVSVDVSRTADQRFRNFRVRNYRLNDLRLCDIACDPVSIERGPSHIESDGVTDCLLMLQLAGEVRIRQAGKDMIVRAGDLAILAADQPYRIVYRQPSRRLFVCVPAERFDSEVIRRARLPIVRQLNNTPTGRIISSFLLTVAAEADNLEEDEGTLIASNLLSVLATLRRSGGPYETENWPFRKAKLTDKIFDFMERHFTDPDLRPLDIAKANNISIRQLHTVVGSSGITVCRWLRERRLKACYEALQNPVISHASISEIAYSHGFNDSAHFSRCFRARFGTTPSKVRAASRN